MISRTAKSCGPGAPGLALSRESDLSTTVTTKPGHRSIECTHLLLRWRAKTDSLLASAVGGGDAGGDWTGAIWRSPPGKRGVSLHEALVRRPCSCIRRLAGNRAREVQFTRFLRNKKVGVAEMASHAAARTADRVAGREVIVVQDTS